MPTTRELIGYQGFLRPFPCPLRCHVDVLRDKPNSAVLPLELCNIASFIMLHLLSVCACALYVKWVAMHVGEETMMFSSYFLASLLSPFLQSFFFFFLIFSLFFLLSSPLYISCLSSFFFLRPSFLASFLPHLSPFLPPFISPLPFFFPFPSSLPYSLSLYFLFPLFLSRSLSYLPLTLLLR